MTRKITKLPRACPVCGKVFMSFQQVYCSGYCKRRALYLRAKARHYKKVIDTCL